MSFSFAARFAAVAAAPIQLPSATTGIAILLGNGDGTFQPATFNTPLGNTAGGSIFACDVNGDGNVDLLASTTKQTQVLLGKGDGTFTTSTAIENTLGVLDATDFNGDGKIDLLAADVSGLLSVHLGNGDGSFGTPILLIAPFSAPVVDFNGDNRPDIAVPVQGSAAFALREAGLVWLFNTSVPPGPDFQIAASALAPPTIASGSSATSTVTLTFVGGFNGAVVLSCNGAPALSTCTVSPNSISLTGSAPGTATVTVTTTAPSKGLLPPTGPGMSRRINYWPAVFVLVFLGTMMVLVLNVLRQAQQSRWVQVFTFVIVVFVALTINSCGGGSSSSGGGGSPGTQAGTYTLTISGTATSGSTTLTHSTNLTLVVQ